MNTLTVGSLFSGGGGLDIAVCEAFGGEVAWHCEVDPAAVKVLAHHWPTVRNLGDITKVDWAAVPRVHVMCGGFPCQDVSSAGRQAGLKSGTRSGLWAMFADAIAALRPRFVVIENVRGLLTADGEAWPDEVVAAHEATEWRRGALAAMDEVPHRWAEPAWRRSEYGRRRHDRLVRQRKRTLDRFRSLRARLVQRAIGTVLGDLADLGYDAQWVTVAASEVGAPHRRERVFILAVDANADHAAGDGEWARPEPRQGDQDAADSEGDGRDERRPESTGFVGGSDVSVGGDGSVKRYRWASSLGPQYAVPVYFDSYAEAAAHRQAAHKLLSGLPGHNSMRVEHWNHGVWNPTDLYGRAHELDLLPTPRASRGASTTETAYALGGERDDTGRTQGEVLLPPPTASRYGSNQSASAGAAVRPSLDSITDLLPTPCARDFKDGTASPGAVNRNTPSLGAKKAKRGRGGPDATERCDGHVALLPTPSAADGNGGGRFNSAGHQSTLPGTVRELLPTPSAADGGGGHLTRSGDRSGELLLPGIARVYGNGELLPTPCARDFKDGTASPGAVNRNTPSLGAIEFYLPTPNASDGTGGGQHPDKRVGHSQQLIDYVLAPERWGKYAPAIARWEQITRPAPSPTQPNSLGNPRLAAGFSEWMMGWPDGWVTDPAIGISRNDQLRIIGNGVCPQQSANALRWLIAVVAEPDVERFVPWTEFGPGGCGEL